MPTSTQRAGPGDLLHVVLPMQIASWWKLCFFSPAALPHLQMVAAAELPMLPHPTKQTYSKTNDAHQAAMSNRVGVHDSIIRCADSGTSDNCVVNRSCLRHPTIVS